MPGRLSHRGYKVIPDAMRVKGEDMQERREMNGEQQRPLTAENAEGADCRACTPRAGRLPWCHVAQARGRGGEEESRAPSGATEIQTPLRGYMDEGGAPPHHGLAPRGYSANVPDGTGKPALRRDPFECGIRNAECGPNGKRQRP